MMFIVIRIIIHYEKKTNFECRFLKSALSFSSLGVVKIVDNKTIRIIYNIEGLSTCGIHTVKLEDIYITNVL